MPTLANTGSTMPMGTKVLGGLDYPKDKKNLSIRQALLRTIDKMGGIEKYNSMSSSDVVDIPNVSLFKTGKYNGIVTTEQHLKDKVQACQELADKRPPIIKITHMDEDEHEMSPELSQYPYSVGEIPPDSMECEDDTMSGLCRLFKWVCDKLLVGQLRSSSAEIKHNMQTQDGKVYPRYFDSLALLGSDREAQWEKLNSYSEQREEMTFEKLIVYQIKEEFSMPQAQEKTPAEQPKVFTEEDLQAKVQEEINKYKESAKKEPETVNYQEIIQSEVRKSVDSIKSDYDKKIKALEDQNKVLYSENARQARMTEINENQVFINDLIKADKFPPSLTKKAMNLLNSTKSSMVVKYSENGTEVEKSFKDELKSFLSELPKSVVYSEDEIAPSYIEDGIEISKEYAERYPSLSRHELIEQRKIEVKAEKYAEKNGVDLYEAYEQVVLFGGK